MRVARVATAAGGILMLGWGAWLLVSDQDPVQLLSVAVWLAAVVVVHDGGLTVASAIRHRLRRSAPVHEQDERSR
ncbi:hypothetical protein [Microbacterium hydrocarbonoxydans]|uniref:hypothetical protein n=1 Tax=Microbacterium hydrocarbonoxydans TaxID=273678 RepID=UPI0007BBDE1B|nr:hypothetical protein [Microbacterium hydrocarbonoxydans]GAT71626.1 hypothetical protein MHM582_0090 [Microbacterium sp. HM58-2]